MGKVWGVYYEDCGENWPRYNGTSLYISLENWNDITRKTCNISRTFVGNKIVDNSDVVGASPVGAASTTSSFST